MKKMLLISLVMIPCLLVGMDDDAKAEREKEATRIAEEIAATRKPRDIEKAAHFLQLKPQPVNIAFGYDDIATLCTYEYVPLMRKLLEKGIVKADAYCSNCTQYPLTLLMEAIYNALVDKHKDLSMVQLLLQKGACSNRAGLSLKDWMSDPVGLKKRYRTPLMRVAFEGNLPLTTLLLEHHADPNLLWQGNTPFMTMVTGYIITFQADKNQPTKQTTQRYSLIEACLTKYKASVTIPSLTGNEVLTPLQLAKKHNRTELVALFEEHLRKKP